jgi:predicted alpha-1,6-mannanase (GH76 family)
MGWRVWAEKAHRLLVDRFWDERHRVFRVRAGRRLRRLPHWHYWWQAHALDSLVDAAARDGDANGPVRAQIGEFIEGIVARNGGRIGNDYRDDMAWMGIAMLRAEAVVGAASLGLVRELWAEILAGWDERHGGVVWRRGDTYTNAPTNAPAAILGARLYARQADPDDLAWARTIDRWLYATLVDPVTGAVRDGVHPDGRPPGSQRYSYNEGTVVGAGVALYRITGDQHYLERAARSARAALSTFVRPNGLLVDEGSVDGGLFKGILARYLGDFVCAVQTMTPRFADESVREFDQIVSNVITMLGRNGIAVAPAAARGPVGPDWARPDAGAGDLSTHLSAVMLLEALARMEAAGIAVEPPGQPP